MSSISMGALETSMLTGWVQDNIIITLLSD